MADETHLNLPKLPIKVWKNILKVSDFSHINKIPIELPPSEHHQIPSVHIGLSGGFDSMVLTHILAQIFPSSKITAIHIRHHLETDEDIWQSACQKFCHQLNINFQIIDGKVNPQNPQGMESAARKQRINGFFSSGAKFIILATHQNDLAETLIHRFLRGGCGSKALSVTQTQTTYKKNSAQINILRPLLETAKTEIMAYAKLNNINAFDDPANFDEVRARAFIRHELMPMIINRYPQFLQTAQKTVSIAFAENELLAKLAQNTADINQEFLDLANFNRLDLNAQQNLLRFFIRKKLDDNNFPETGLPSFNQLNKLITDFAHVKSGEQHFAIVPTTENALKQYYWVIWHNKKIFVRVNISQGIGILEKPIWQPVLINVFSDNEDGINVNGGKFCWRWLNANDCDNKNFNNIAENKIINLRILITARQAQDKIKIHPLRPHKSLRKWMNEKSIPVNVRELLPVIRGQDITDQNKMSIIAVLGVGVSVAYNNLNVNSNSRCLVFSFHHPLFGEFNL